MLIKKSKEPVNDEDFDLVGNSVEKKKQEKKPIWFIRHKYLTAILAGVLVMIIVCANITAKMDKQKKEEAQAEVDRITLLKSEPHTAKKYYVEECGGEEAIDATARLIGHVMSTGCSKAYGILLDNFPDDSNKYLQDYLTGASCEKYTPPNVVLMSRDNKEYVYLVRINVNINRYLVHITYYDNKPTGYWIEKYINNDAITEKTLELHPDYDD